MSEQWKPIPGYEGWYEISDLGNIRSLDREIVQLSKSGGLIRRRIKGCMVEPTDNGHGYLIVGLRKNQSRKNFYVHRLVADIFLDNPMRFPVVNHLDYNRRNNTVKNLEWTTQAENIRYSSSRMRKPKSSKLPETGYKYITRKGSSWRLNIQSLNIDKKYRTLSEAIEARGVIMGDKEYHAER